MLLRVRFNPHHCCHPSLPQPSAQYLQVQAEGGQEGLKFLLVVGKPIGEPIVQCEWCCGLFIHSTAPQQLVVPQMRCALLQRVLMCAVVEAVCFLLALHAVGTLLG